jgi:putative hydroxymethylpyrimidine transport system permease protein
MIRGLVAAAGLVLLWQAFVVADRRAAFPAALPLARRAGARRPADALAGHTLVTAAEILAGLVLGSLLVRAMALTLSRLARRPALAAAAAADSQAVRSSPSRRC